MGEIHDRLERLVKTIPYKAWAVTNPVDAGKVAAELNGDRRPLAGSGYARELIGLARLDAPFDPLGFWRSRGWFMSWGFTNGTFTPAQLATRAKAQGVGWIAVEDTAGNRARATEIRTACQQNGVKLVTWRWASTVAESQSCINAFQPTGHIENVEHYDWQPDIPVALRATHPRMPLGTVTNFTGTGAMRDGSYSKAASAPWVNNGWAYLTEAYMVNEQGQQPSLSPAILDWTAKTHLGVPETFPTVGIYRVPYSFYTEPLASFPYHSVYLAEYL